MKKKIFLFLTLGSILLFSVAKTANAGCSPQTGGTTCNKILCNTRICCDTQLDCDEYRKTIPAPQPLPGSPTQDSDLHCGESGINTAIGCINVLGSQEEFLGDILRWSVGVGGGIAFLLILYASFMIMSSGGNPERLKAGQELLTSAISGLILLIFSIFILKFIGVDILGLDKFGFGN